MSDLTELRDYAQGMARGRHRPLCRTWVRHDGWRPRSCSAITTPCDCDPPDTTERRMWQAIADELDAYLDHQAADDDPEMPL